MPDKQDNQVKISLQKLLQGIIDVPASAEKNITGISLDSRTVRPGTLFLACLGEQYDGRKYIQEAITQGAVAVVAEGENNKINQDKYADIPILSVQDLKKYVGIIAGRFYDDPSAAMTVIGITGTNGKTSCSQFIARSLQMAGQSCGIIGTLGAGFPDHLEAVSLTTPDPVTLQQELASFKQQGAAAVSMEVSSHSLAQQRVQGIHFTTAVFTNLTRDHLDYHGDMIHYAAAKRQLFEMPGLRYAVINLDDEYGRQFLKQMPASIRVYGYSIADHEASVPVVRAENIHLNEKGFSATIKSPWGEGELHSQLMGRFNLSNLLATLTVLNLLKIPFAQTLQYLSAMTTVPGRMQIFGGDKQPIVVVDYAHTPDALEQALKALREHCQGKLWCVFGCGGERDRGKRPMMAQVAEKMSDQVIVTDDNPRCEYSQKIIEDIVQGFLYPHAVITIPDRRMAIQHAINTAKVGDVILIAGKGHEPYQIIGKEKLPFSDAEEVKTQLNKKLV